MTAFLVYYAILHAMVMGLLLPAYANDPLIRRPFLAVLLWPVWLFLYVLTRLAEPKHGP